MDVEVAPEAIEVLKRSLELAGLDPATHGVRLRTSRGLGGGTSIQVELAESPLAGEETVEVGGIKLFVDPEVLASVPDPLVTVEPQHETIVVRPRS